MVCDVSADTVVRGRLAVWSFSFLFPLLVVELLPLLHQSFKLLLLQYEGCCREKIPLLTIFVKNYKIPSLQLYIILEADFSIFFLKPLLQII